MRRRERVEGDQVLLGLLEQGGDLRRGLLKPPDHLACALACLSAALGVEDLAQGGGDKATLGRAAVLVHVAHEVNRATLPGTGEHALDRILQALVLVGDAKAHAGEPAALE